ncbi:MAG TPA: serine/threonine-protein kinase [Solirubrobacteraceae bacterium]|nr:serine/threonine-protein kinase [Solirubrobacteraceae bacterium]
MTAGSGPTVVPAPLILDRYRLRRRLGAGGFGTVWAAQDERLGRDVAVKILPVELVAAGRFEREAHAAARLSHPAVVTLYEAAADEDGAYLVSELVRGSTLARALDAGRLSDREIAAIGIDMCDALGHAHGQGVVHRDLKPSNVLLPARAGARPDDAGPVAKLTDFGVARLVGGDALTRSGELVGTAAYMAPEQAEGREAAEPADLYSLALVLYEALTGVNPLIDAGPRTRRLALYLPPLRRQRRELPRELGQAIDLALRPRPRERGTLGELRAALVAGAAQLSEVRGVVAPPRLTAGGHSRPAAASHTRPVAGEPSGPTADPRAAGEDPALGTRRGRPRSDTEENSVPRLGLPPLPPPQPIPPIVRGLAATVAAALAAWVGAHLLHPALLPPATLALVAGVAILLLPRLGWLLTAAAAVIALSAQGQAGIALLLGLSALAPLLVLPLAAGRWPLPALAPLLGLVGLAGAWPALAAQARGPWRRAALGALGWGWLVSAQALQGRELYVRLPAGLPLRSLWANSPYAATHDLLGALVPELAAGALVWAAAAAILPWLRARRSPGADALAVAVWTFGLAAGSELVLAILAPGTGVPASTLLAGAVAAAGGALLCGPHRSSLARGRWRGVPPRLA